MLLQPLKIDSTGGSRISRPEVRRHWPIAATTGGFRTVGSSQRVLKVTSTFDKRRPLQHQNPGEKIAALAMKLPFNIVRKVRNYVDVEEALVAG